MGLSFAFAFLAYSIGVGVAMVATRGRWLRVFILAWGFGAILLIALADARGHAGGKMATAAIQTAKLVNTIAIKRVVFPAANLLMPTIATLSGRAGSMPMAIASTRGMKSCLRAR